jgi:hypothetical protein
MSRLQFALDLANELKWPVVIAIVAIVAIAICRNEVRDFIRRTYWISPTAVKATRQNPQIASSSTHSVPAISSPDFGVQLSATVDPYVLAQRVNTIYADFDSRGIRPGEREEPLIQLLAAALTREFWERVYLLIFGSQIRLLQKLNESPQGIAGEEIRDIYQTAASQYHDFYRNFTFENWINFTDASSLTTKESDGRHFITHSGRGFLKYLVAQGLSPDRPG